MFRFIIIVSLLFFSSCQKNTETKYNENVAIAKNIKVTEPDKKDSIISVNEKDTISTTPSFTPKDTFLKRYTTINFTNFSISFDETHLWNEKSDFSKVYQDTCIIYLGLTSNIGGWYFTVDDTINSQSRVFEKEITSLVITDEGPHLDLTNWKHYESTWKEVETNGNTFFIDSLIYTDSLPFPETTNTEIVNYLTEEQYEPLSRWVDLAKTCKSANTYPCQVMYSQLIVNIKRLNKDFYIIFVIPMGC